MSDGREPPAWILAAQARWADAVRPGGIEPAGPGQESVWDYPRPPRLERHDRPVSVTFAGREIVSTSDVRRVCETASPPTYYVPIAAVSPGVLVDNPHSSMCEWKGEAAYFDVVVDERCAAAAAWTYPSPFRPFGALAGWLAFMPAAMDECRVGAHRVEPQPGGFYGGWITPELTGPFKGAPGTGHW